MASKLFIGTLLNPTGEPAAGDKYRFTQKSTLGDVVEESISTLTINDSGTYQITLEYGSVQIESCSAQAKRWYKVGEFVIDDNTDSATLPDLIAGVESEIDYISITELITTATNSYNTQVNQLSGAY